MKASLTTRSHSSQDIPSRVEVRRKTLPGRTSKQEVSSDQRYNDNGLTIIDRLVVAYELAQLSTTARKLPRAGASLLVLGSGNVDGMFLSSCLVSPCCVWDILAESVVCFNANTKQKTYVVTTRNM